MSNLKLSLKIAELKLVDAKGNTYRVDVPFTKMNMFRQVAKDIINVYNNSGIHIDYATILNGEIIPTGMEYILDDLKIYFPMN